MAVPKRKTSKMKVRSRRSSHKATVVETRPCPQCSSAQQPHRVCRSCGYYGGRQVTTIEAD
ncbi:MAG: 50S ribosomal protein L32 [bacterium]